jgi:hypothetical protein
VFYGRKEEKFMDEIAETQFELRHESEVRRRKFEKVEAKVASSGSWRSTTGKNPHSVSQNNSMAPSRLSPKPTTAVYFADEDFSDDDHIQAAIKLHDADFSDDEHILASI